MRNTAPPDAAQLEALETREWLESLDDVLKHGGAARVGRLLREFMSLQTHANDGYGFDPEHPEHVYLPGKRGWLTRFKVNYATHEWTVDAV